MNHTDTASMVHNAPEPIGPVLTKEDLSRRWKISIPTIERLTRDRVHGIRFFRIGRNVRYRLRDVEEFESHHLSRQRPF